MNILQIIPSSSPFYGGPREAAFGLGRALLKSGVKVEIAATRLEKMEADGDLPLHEFPIERGSVFPSHFFYSPALKTWLYKNLGRFNLVHIHGLFNYPSNQACKTAIRYGIPYILRPCGMLNPWSLKRSKFKKKLWFSLFERENLEKAAFLHLTSEREKSDVEDLGVRTKGVIIPIGVDQSGKREGLSNEALTKMFSKLTGKRKILFLSRLHPKKGLNHLIPALETLSKKRDDFFFILSGRGEPGHERDIDQLLDHHELNKRSIKTGFVEKSDKSFIYSNSDLFVLPSYHENFGLAVAEAMGVGLPVVVSDQVDIYHDVQGYNAGLVTSCNVEEIAAAIEKVLDDESLRKRMGENGKRLVREKFSWDVITPKIIKLYEQALARKMVGDSV